MIAHIEGVLLDRDESGGTVLTLETGGLGYEVTVYDGFPQSSSYRLWIHSAVSQPKGKPPETTLYGFTFKVERDLFRHLLSISGVGVKTALKLMSLGPERVISAVVVGDETKLKVKGVPANARKAVIAYKDKLLKFSSSAGIELDEVASVLPEGVQDQVEETLAALGFSGKEISTAISHLESLDMLDPDAEDYTRVAISYLSGL